MGRHRLRHDVANRHDDRSAGTAVSELTGAARRAAAFRRMRDAQRTEVAEDYVELIGDLIAETGEARLTDLSEHLGVSHATAAKVVQRLQREGLVESRPYRSIFLTEDGAAVAAMSRDRHRIVHEFLRALGVSELNAEADAEGIEHHVSQETLDALARLTRKLAKS
ncbi:manganese-binding transcriptional regulator MntR [Sphingomonas alpina]|uniref:Transcriptional regulator MntR n=1 Tax=Sphingomonas alpina TaxID=653931 RepID=A0A7H0LKW8_9SPHN|nr:manganese-binding transcriptional regulator MntR [Sphingomonas alpina]QNQ10321.1 manganese-binding transcriptional regulator MntR [Sphingomonas alpina]